MSWRVFFARDGEHLLSFDRTTIAPLPRVAEAALQTGAPFHGWAIVIASDAAQDGRTVVQSPVPGNEFHAEVVLPFSAAQDYEIRKYHAMRLSKRMRGWQDAPDKQA